MGQSESAPPPFKMNAIVAVCLIGSAAVCTAYRAYAESPQPSTTAESKTAWNDGYPLKGLKNTDAFIVSFKDKAKHLGKDGKLRILIIGDSLSDGSYHWSHHFRKNLQTAYGNGGPGKIWAVFAGDSAEHGAVPGWLWSEKDFVSYKGPHGRWQNSSGGRGDIWP